MLTLFQAIEAAPMQRMTMQQHILGTLHLCCLQIWLFGYLQSSPGLVVCFWGNASLLSYTAHLNVRKRRDSEFRAACERGTIDTPQSSRSRPLSDRHRTLRLQKGSP